MRSGCNGGFSDAVWNWVKSSGGQATRESYPYTSGSTKVQGKCRQNAGDVSVPNVTGVWKARFYPDVENHYKLKVNDTQVMNYVRQFGPVVAYVNVGNKMWQMYGNNSGVIRTADCPGRSDHAVVIVGYGTYQGLPCWIIRNSWGKGYGYGGHVFLERSIDGHEGACGVTVNAMAPILDGERTIAVNEL